MNQERSPSPGKKSENRRDSCCPGHRPEGSVLPHWPEGTRISLPFRLHQNCRPIGISPYGATKMEEATKRTIILEGPVTPLLCFLGVCGLLVF